MSRIRSKDTKPERLVRSSLHKKGYRFKLSNANLPGKPDVVLAKYNTIIFVHGCFWHQHKNCIFAYMPKSRVDFWEKKLEGNVARYKKQLKELKSTGWNVITVWECEVKRNLPSVIKRIEKSLSKMSADNYEK